MSKVEEIFFKKQVIYPPLYARVILGLLDISLFFVVIDGVFGIFKYINLIIFTQIFSEFLTKENIELTMSTFEEISSHKTLFSEENTKNFVYFYLISPLVQFAITGIYVIACWVKLGQTPLKYLFKMKILTRDNFSKPSLFQFILRYIFLITIPIGIIIALFSKELRTLHDLISSTFVVSNTNNNFKDSIK